jgi:hypothetical protein
MYRATTLLDLPSAVAPIAKAPSMSCRGVGYGKVVTVARSPGVARARGHIRTIVLVMFALAMYMFALPMYMLVLIMLGFATSASLHNLLIGLSRPLSQGRVADGSLTHGYDKPGDS